MQLYSYGNIESVPLYKWNSLLHADSHIEVGDWRARLKWVMKHHSRLSCVLTMNSLSYETALGQRWRNAVSLRLSLFNEVRDTSHENL